MQKLAVEKLEVELKNLEFIIDLSSLYFKV